MKTLNIKFSYNKLGFVILVLSSLLVFSIYSCNKQDKEECVKCKNSENKQTKNVLVNNQNYNALTYNTAGYPIITSINQEEITNIESEIKNQLQTKGIEIANYSPFGLVKFYNQLIQQGSNINESSLTSILVYYTNTQNQKTYASFWKKNSVNNSFSFVPHLSGLNNFISPTNFFQLDQIENLQTEEIILLVDDTKLPEKIYSTVFQIKLETLLISTNAPPGGGGGGGSGGPNCEWCRGGSQGMCIRCRDCSGGLSPVSAFVCVPKPEDCYTNLCMPLLSSEGYTLSEEDIKYLYFIRDSVLMKTEKGQQIIDDYYYSGGIMKGKISFSLAWKLYKLYGINLFERFAQFFTETTYDGNVLIDGVVLNIINEACDEARDISNDERFQSIINNTEAEVNLFYNKPFSDIRNAYQ
jgi:hypothetical protein